MARNRKQDSMMAAGSGPLVLQGDGAYGSRRPKQVDPQLAAEWWTWRVRHLAALMLSWGRQASRVDVGEEEKGRRLQANEVAQRQAKADLWRATADCTRKVGDERARFTMEPNTDRHLAVTRLQHDATELHNTMCRLRVDRHRRRRGLPALDRDAEPSEAEPPRLGPFDVDVDDLEKLLAMPPEQMIQHLEENTLMSQPPVRRYKPGEVPQPGSAKKPPTPPPTLAGRPSPPKPVHQTLQGAMDLEMPFGKYKGQPLGALLEDDEGMSYLWWLANEASITSKRLTEAVAALWEVYEDECEEARSKRSGW